MVFFVFICFFHDGNAMMVQSMTSLQQRVVGGHMTIEMKLRGPYDTSFFF